METLQYHTRDKTIWGPGPWQEEPDKIQFPDPDTGLPCLIVRNHSGSLCGYVGVDAGHPYYGRDYSDLENIEVHGCLTFTDSCRPHEPGKEGDAICHIPAEGESDDVWWLGFDCSHAFDYMPAYASVHLKPLAGDVYRDVAYVKSEIAQLARQIQEVTTHE
jgi:hypothetical protein